MATKKNAPEPETTDPVNDYAAELSELEQMRADLKAARARTAELEAVVGVPEAEDDDGEFVNDRRLTHQHDIERFWRLGRLSPRAVLRFQESGQLPKPGTAG